MVARMRFESPKRKAERISCRFTKEVIAVGFVLLNLFLLSFSTSAIAADIDLGGESKLVIHGFLSQAYAKSSMGVYEGIPEDGTTDYRNVALQFRYEYSTRDALVLQFSEQRLGKSPLQPYLGLELNWVFYERQLLDGTTIKVGKFPTPMGIYNEVLHVGTVLPFYRPPLEFYGDGAFSSETINGVGLYQTIPLGKAWSLEADLYAGEWTFFQVIGPDVTATRSNNVLGGQFWLNTPLEGVRLGLGGSRATDSNRPLNDPSAKATDLNWYASLDGRFDRFLVQAEYRWWRLGHDWTFRDYYALAGVNIIGGLMVNFQAEVANLDIPGFVSNLNLNRDYAVGVRYAVRPNLILKAEEHVTKGYDSDVPSPDFTGSPVKQDYYIASLAVSF